MKKRFLLYITLLSLTLTGCHAFRTPPPGWRDPVYRLLLQEESFPPSWDTGYKVAENVKDPTTNHVTMEWVDDDGGLVYQSIWRAYAIEDAQSKFKQLKQERYGPNQTLSPMIKYVAFSSPSKIKPSTKADEFYVACGWLDSEYCVTIARYRNYVVALTSDLSATIGGYTQDRGLTYAQTEALIQDMDKIFDTIQK